MAINFCTLTNSTIDTFCGNRRQLILDRLLDEKYPPVVPTIRGTNNASLRQGALPWVEQGWREREQPQQVFQFEQPIVTIAVEFMGSEGRETQDMLAAQVDFVSVTGFEVTSSQQISVSIDDLEVS